MGMNEQPKIAVVLATFNGGEYLSAQLDSILAQTHQNYILVARDDCSSDNTLEILDRYLVQHPGVMHLLPPDSINRGASASFSCLLEYVLDHKLELGLDIAYIMFCDQDDVWYENKMELELEAMLKAEAGRTDQPVLVHSDLQVVSESLAPIAASFTRYQGLEMHRNKFGNIVISNLVTGCTALINEALALKARPVSRQAIMHDWWLALVAAAFGKLVYLDTPLVDYRQHGSNTIGAKEYIRKPMKKGSILGSIVRSKSNTHLFDVARQARAFEIRYRKFLSFKMRLSLLVAGAMGIRIGLCQRALYLLARRI